MDAVAWEVLARFRSTEAMDRAIEKLKVSGFERGDLGLPEVDPPPERATDEAGSMAADTGTGAQQSRIFYSTVAGAIAAMIGALIAATQRGGIAAIAGAAIGAGIVVAIVAELVVRAFGNAAQKRREVTAAHGKLVLSVRTGSADRRERACTVLREAGGELL
ncbi:MAG: hypothetical protein ABI369_11395 [Acetobacteraceae bacterium]